MITIWVGQKEEQSERKIPTEKKGNKKERKRKEWKKKRESFQPTEKSQIIRRFEPMADFFF